MRTLLFLLVVASWARPVMAQQNPVGRFSLGMRSTLSMFNHEESTKGSGVGGHFRLRILDRLNTEWFADYLTSGYADAASRRDYHIGWSVMYYLVDPKGFERKLTPYLISGHCFDYSELRMKPYPSLPVVSEEPLSRWTSAIQAGLGTHYNITPRFDLSLAAQYMMHFGKDLHLEVREAPALPGEAPSKYYAVEQEDHGGIEGHLLISLSMNFKLGRL